MIRWSRRLNIVCILPLLVLLAGCNLEDRVNELFEDDDITPPEIDQTPPSRDTSRVDSGIDFVLKFSVSDDESLEGTEDRTGLSCFGAVEVLSETIVINDRESNATFELRALEPDVDTAYGCQFTIEDAAGNTNSIAFNGLVVLPDTTPPTLTISVIEPTAEDDEGFFAVALDAEDDRDFGDDPIGFSCAEGVTVTPSVTTIDGRFAHYELTLEAPEAETNDVFVCEYEVRDAARNFTFVTDRFVRRERGLSDGSPELTGDFLKDIASGGTQTVTFLREGLLGGIDALAEITECSSDVSFSLLNSTLNARDVSDDAGLLFYSNESVYSLNAPVVEVDTPYSCNLVGGIAVSQPGEPQLTGTIKAPDTTAFDNALPFVFNEVIWGEQQTPVASYLQPGDPEQTIVIYEPPQTVVSAVALPELERSCVTAIEGITSNNVNGTSFQFDCTQSSDETQNPISREGAGVWNLSPADGSELLPLLEFEQSGNGVTTTSQTAFNTYTGNLYDTSGQQIVLVDSNGNRSSALAHIPFVGVGTEDSFGNEGPDAIRPALSISKADGLSSILELYSISDYDQIRTVLYTTPEAGRLSGFYVVIDVPPANGADSVKVSMVPENLVSHINDNGFVVNQIAVVAVKQDNADAGSTPPTPAPEVFTPDAPPVGDPPPEVGMSISTTVSAITPQSVCPADTDNQVRRCSRGTTEFLLSMNASDEVALYDSFNGDHKGFFLDGEDFSHLGTNLSGVLASQAPDHCVLYSDGDGNLLLFDTVDNAAPSGNDQILGDGQGNIIANGGSLLEGAAQTQRVVSYRGFDFYSANNSTDWKLFIAVQSTDGAGTFTNQILRYDYALDGNTVLSNPMVIATDTATSNQASVFYSVQVADQKIFVTQDVSSGPDRIRVFQPDGTELDELFDIDTVRAGSEDIRDIRQITETFTGDLAVVNFSSFTPALRVIGRDDPGTLVRSYTLTEQLRGVAHLRNGDYLVAGELDIDRSVVNQFTGETRKVPDGSPRTTFNRQGIQIGRACLP